MSATRLPEDDPDVQDMHVARILEMTDDEIRAEVIAAGEDPDAVAARMRRELQRAIARYRHSGNT